MYTSATVPFYFGAPFSHHAYISFNNNEQPVTTPGPKWDEWRSMPFEFYAAISDTNQKPSHSCTTETSSDKGVCTGRSSRQTKRNIRLVHDNYMRTTTQTTQSTWNTPWVLTIHHIRSNIRALMQRKKSDNSEDDKLPELETPQALTFVPAAKASSQFVVSVVR